MQEILKGTLKIEGCYVALHYDARSGPDPIADLFIVVHQDEGGNIEAAREVAGRLIGKPRSEVLREFADCLVRQPDRQS